MQNVIWTCVNKIVEPLLNLWPAKMLRDTALKNIMNHIHYEDESTRYLCVCPVNKVMHARILFDFFRFPSRLVKCQLFGLMDAEVLFPFPI